mmetsp:Transcript_38281/g.91655  ORF Transcript_38281/g.91655 Transcript_38281/m.91655 type:complete len:322 (+) Transcript_38281:1686-2651(+)
MTVVPGVTLATAMSLFVTSPFSLISTLILTSTSSFSSLRSLSDCARASAEPCTSALTTTQISRSSFCPPAKMPATDCMRPDWYDDAFLSRAILALDAASSLAVCSSSATTKRSPASGTPLIPTMLTGVLGPASLYLVLPSKPISALTLPFASPATNESPTRTVPLCMSVVATVPSPFSTRASRTTPCASLSGFALRSSSSAWSITLLRRSSSPVPSFALIWEQRTSPPRSSVRISYPARSARTRLGSAVSRSILFTATMSGTAACLAHAMESAVCCFTLSSAATTRMIMSAVFAPRSLMSVNAACPGVSMKVIVSPSWSAW